MKKIVTGLSMLSMLALAAGCSDDNTWATGAGNTGKANFALQGDGYRLTGVINILEDDAGNPGAPTGKSINADEGDAAATIALEVGSYHAQMTTWELFDADGSRGSNETPNDVEFLGFTPAPFVILADDVTNVTATFEIGNDVVVVITPPETGDANIVLVGNELDCDPGCSGDALCTQIGDGDPYCADQCAAAADVDNDDCAGRACLESDGGGTFVCAPEL